MYERFRIRVDTQREDNPEAASFQMPPPRPEAADLGPAAAQQQSPEVTRQRPGQRRVGR